MFSQLSSARPPSWSTGSWKPRPCVLVCIQSQTLVSVIKLNDTEAREIQLRDERLVSLSKGSDGRTCRVDEGLSGLREFPPSGRWDVAAWRPLLFLGFSAFTVSGLCRG